MTLRDAQCYVMCCTVKGLCQDDLCEWTCKHAKKYFQAKWVQTRLHGFRLMKLGGGGGGGEGHNHVCMRK